MEPAVARIVERVEAHQPLRVGIERMPALSFASIPADGPAVPLRAPVSRHVQ
jgi:hypothetical protein